jgi:hypothetical protein
MRESTAPAPDPEDERDKRRVYALEGTSHLRFYYNAAAARGMAEPLDLRVVVSVPDDEWGSLRRDPRALMAICMDGMIAAIRSVVPVGASLSRSVDHAAALMKERLYRSDTSSILVVSQCMIDGLGNETKH